MINFDEGRHLGRNLSEQKSLGTMTNLVGNTMGSLEVSPLLRSDNITSTRYKPAYSP